MKTNPIKSVAHSATGIIGVQGPYLRHRQRMRKTGVYPQVEEYYQATWMEQGKKRKRQFSINHYGYHEALACAITTRLEHEYE